MKTMIKKSSLVLITLLASTQMGWAGWGVIACSNNNGVCTMSQGEIDYATAFEVAMDRCEEEYGNCALARWEHNNCVSTPSAGGRVAEACN